MAEKNPKSPEEKLDDIIEKFFEVYRILSPEEKVKFEIGIVKKNKDADERTKNLYAALIDAVKRGLTVKEAITKMGKVK